MSEKNNVIYINDINCKYPDWAYKYYEFLNKAQNTNSIMLKTYYFFRAIQVLNKKEIA